jgi:hypothetical protein
MPLSISKTSSASKSNRRKLVLEFDGDFEVWSERPSHARKLLELA